MIIINKTKLLYIRQCDVEQPELVKFISLGKDLGVFGLLEKVDNTKVNISMKNNLSDVNIEENVETRCENINKSAHEDFINNKRVYTDSSELMKYEFTCNDCEAVFRSKMGLNYHIERVHKDIRYECFKTAISRHLHESDILKCPQIVTSFNFLSYL